MVYSYQLPTVASKLSSAKGKCSRFKNNRSLHSFAHNMKKNLHILNQYMEICENTGHKTLLSSKEIPYKFLC